MICKDGDRHSDRFNHRIDSGDPAGQNGLIAKAEAIASHQESAVSKGCDRHLTPSISPS